MGAHYFEEGNVQLDAKHECRDSTIFQVITKLTSSFNIVFSFSSFFLAIRFEVFSSFDYFQCMAYEGSNCLEQILYCEEYEIYSGRIEVLELLTVEVSDFVGLIYPAYGYWPMS